MNRKISTTEQLWVAEGHRTGAYDATGRTLDDLVHDFHQTQHVIGQVIDGLQDAAAQDRHTTAYSVELDHLTARIHLIRAAIESHGCQFDGWADEGHRTITDQDGHTVARY